MIQTPGPLAKANTQASATIGEQFTYRITVPATPIAVPLYDVRILDDLGLSAANLRFVGARVVSGGSWALSNTGSATDLVIEDTATGIDIPAGGQAVIEITVELQNTATDQSGLSFKNSASYTYNRMNGNERDANGRRRGHHRRHDGGRAGPDAPPRRCVSSPRRANRPTDPAAAGDVLEYALTVPNSGDSTAFDTERGRHPAGEPDRWSPVPRRPDRRRRRRAVSSPNPTASARRRPGLGAAERGRHARHSRRPGAGADLSGDRGVGSPAASIENSAYVDWTSLDGGAARASAPAPAARRRPPPTTTATVRPSATVSTLDNTSIAKAVVEDSYAETPASTTDPVVRVGDTVTYDLTLNLQEYTTRNVVVEDTLPAGMALESFTINGGANFSYTLAAQPAAGATGTLRWEFGDITNQPSNDGTPLDPLVIRYVAKVVTDAPPAGVAYDSSISLDNQAQLSYASGDPAADPERLTATERIDVRQPQMSADHARSTWAAAASAPAPRPTPTRSTSPPM